MLQRFFPSEFGADPDRTQVSDIDNNFYARKAEIRRLIEAEGIPHTYICCNFFMTVLLPSLVQPGRITPPTDKAIVFGDGNVKGLTITFLSASIVLIGKIMIIGVIICLNLFLLPVLCVFYFYRKCCSSLAAPYVLIVLVSESKLIVLNFGVICRLSISYRCFCKAKWCCGLYHKCSGWSTYS